MVKVLHIVGNMNMGGQETFIMNLYRKIDKEKIQFDFLVEKNVPENIASEIVKMGGKIYKIHGFSIKNIIKHIVEIHKVFKSNQYDILHSHSIETRPFIPIIAKLHRIRVRIIHSHESTFNDKSQILLKKILKRITILFSNRYMACSKDAANFLLGKNSKKNVYIMKNGINIEEFKFNNKNRIKIRENLNIKDEEILIGNIGRFAYLKNQDFAIDVFNEIRKINNKTKLILIGDGNIRKKLEEKCKQYGIADSVIFTGKQDNINEYISALDLFLFPSIKEGLGISLIEAQANKLICVVSNGVPKEAYVLDNIIMIPLEKSAKDWASIIINYLNNNYERNLNEQEKNKLNIYDITQIANKYQEYIIGEVNL